MEGMRESGQDQSAGLYFPGPDGPAAGRGVASTHETGEPSGGRKKGRKMYYTNRA